jgi:phage tail protein X
MPTNYTTIEGDTVDLIAWNQWGVTLGATEAILEANPGLAAQGTKLPQGLTIILPDYVVKKTQTAARIWS